MTLFYKVLSGHNQFEIELKSVLSREWRTFSTSILNADRKINSHVFVIFKSKETKFDQDGDTGFS